MNNFAAGTPLDILSSNPPSIQRVPAVINLNLLPDMGRMTVRLATRGADEAGADAPPRNAGGGCAAGGIPALRREQLHHRGGDRHRRRCIRLAPSDFGSRLETC